MFLNVEGQPIHLLIDSRLFIMCRTFKRKSRTMSTILLSLLSIWTHMYYDGDGAMPVPKILTGATN
jgi:hypothetical protein